MTPTVKCVSVLLAASAGLVGPLASHAEAQPSDQQPTRELAQLEPRLVDGLEFQPGKGLSAKSADGDFSFSISLRNQLLLTLQQLRGEADPEPDPTLGLQLRRSRLIFKGTAFDPHTKLESELDFAPRGVDTAPGGAPVRTSPLLTLAMRLQHVRDLQLRVGQYKVPFLRETILSDGNQELVDSSLVNSRFTMERDIGLDFGSTDLFGLDKRLRYNLGVYTGEGRNSFEQNSFGLMYLARVEVLPFGSFDDYSQADFARSKPRVALGAAYAYHSRAQRNSGVRGALFADGGTADYRSATADIVFKAAGFGLFGAFAWREGERNPGGAVDDMGAPIDVEATRDGFGAVGQVSYLLPYTSLGVAARYAVVRGSGSDSNLADENEVGGGVSYYFAQHALKLQADAFRLWESDSGFDRGNDQARLQLQLTL